MAKWAEFSELLDIREAYDRLEEINRTQAATIERQAEEMGALTRLLAEADGEGEHLREQLRQAQQALRNARDSALEEALAVAVREAHSMGPYAANHIVIGIRALKSTTQGGRE